MKIEYASTTLFDQELPAGQETLVYQVAPKTEIVELWQGAAAVPLARGQRRRTYPLTVAQVFASQRLAEEFFLAHEGTLPAVGTLTFTCGYTGDTSTKTAEAVLESIEARLVAPLVVEVRYLFTLEAGPA